MPSCGLRPGSLCLQPVVAFGPTPLCFCFLSVRFSKSQIALYQIAIISCSQRWIDGMACVATCPWMAPALDSAWRPIVGLRSLIRWFLRPPALCDFFSAASVSGIVFDHAYRLLPSGPRNPLCRWVEVVLSWRLCLCAPAECVVVVAGLVGRHRWSQLLSPRERVDSLLDRLSIASGREIRLLSPDATFSGLFRYAWSGVAC